MKKIDFKDRWAIIVLQNLTRLPGGPSHVFPHHPLRYYTSMLSVTWYNPLKFPKLSYYILYNIFTVTSDTSILTTTLPYSFQFKKTGRLASLADLCLLLCSLRDFPVK